MPYLITHKPAYDNSFIDLPTDTQRRATAAIRDLEIHADQPRGNTIKKLSGWVNVWRYRLGDYRLIYALHPEQNLVSLLLIGHRSKIYDHFDPDYDETAPPRDFNKLTPVDPIRAEKKVDHTDIDWAKLYQNQKPLPQELLPNRLKRWHIPEEYIPALKDCKTESDLMNVTKEGVPNSILEQVLELLYTPRAEEIASQPDQMLFDPADLEKYAEGTLRTFLLKLDEDQVRYVDWALAGPTLVKGGPGTGKSTVALYRVRAILNHARQQGDEPPRILFTTYTNALTNFSHSLLSQLVQDVPGLPPDKNGLPQNIAISTVDRQVMHIVLSTQPTQPDMADRHDQLDVLRATRSSFTPPGDDEMEILYRRGWLGKLSDDYLLAEFDWVIEGQNCRTETDYLQANRTGRSTGFTESHRQIVWALYQAYSRGLQRRNKTTWGQLRQLALQAVQENRYQNRWDYIIVDEAQDLTPAALALCVELCHAPTGLFLTADANQSLYNKGFSWNSVHEQLQVQGKSRILKRNYRSTKDIVYAATDILQGDEAFDSEAYQQSFEHKGVKPLLYAAKNSTAQVEWVAEQIVLALKKLRLPQNAAAVLVPSRTLGLHFITTLKDLGLPATYTTSRDLKLEAPGIKVMSLQSAKGLEFPIVALPYVEAGRLPADTTEEDPAVWQAHVNTQRRLFYVACTRAMRYLFVSYERTIPSMFVKDLSEGYWERV